MVDVDNQGENLRGSLDRWLQFWFEKSWFLFEILKLFIKPMNMFLLDCDGTWYMLVLLLHLFAELLLRFSHTMRNNGWHCLPCLFPEVRGCNSTWRLLPEVRGCNRTWCILGPSVQFLRFRYTMESLPCIQRVIVQ